MNRLARRWAPHVCALLLVALAPVVLHAYVGVESDDCANPTAVAPAWAPEDKPETWINYIGQRMKPGQWRDGTVRDSAGSLLHYVIARGFDAKYLYYRPEYKLMRQDRPRSHEIEWMDVDGERVPVHRPIYGARLGNPMIGVAAYVILYDGKPVDDPYRTQLLSAPLQIVRGRLNTTLFFVSGLVLRTEVKDAEAREREWLASALRNYRKICAP